MRAIIVLVAAACALGGESPNLEPRVQPDSSPPSIVLRNAGASAAIAYNLVVSVPASGKRKAASEWKSWDALFDGDDGVRIDPGADRRVETRFPSRLNPAVRAAVLYENGTTAGDPDDVRRLLDVRQASLSDMANVRMLIRSSADAGALRLELEKLRKRDRKPPTPVVRPGASRQERQRARDAVRLHYAASRLPAVVLRWLDQTVDKAELMSRLDRLEGEISRSEK